MAVRADVGGAVNLWYFQSPKNRRKYIFCGELVFLQAILLEADLSVSAYAPSSARDGTEAYPPHLIATNGDGGTTKYFIHYDDGRRRAGTEGGAPEQPGESNGTRTLIVSDRELTNRSVEIDNWIFLCAAINRARMHPFQSEAETLRRLSGTEGVTLARALNEEGADPALMLGAIGAGLQRGSYWCETVRAPLTLSSVIMRARPT